MFTNSILSAVLVAIHQINNVIAIAIQAMFILAKINLRVGNKN
ncbi:MAG: hypothetical protein V7K55_24915 [Nostoc sp.]